MRAGSGKKMKVAIRPRALKVEVHQNLVLQAQSQEDADMSLPAHRRVGWPSKADPANSQAVAMSRRSKDKRSITVSTGPAWQVQHISRQEEYGSQHWYFHTDTSQEGVAHQHNQDWCPPAAQVVEVDGGPQGPQLGETSRETVCACTHLSGVQLTSQQESGAVRACTGSRMQQSAGEAQMVVAVRQDTDLFYDVGALGYAQAGAGSSQVAARSHSPNWPQKELKK